jgi:hypothetical protein
MQVNQPDHFLTDVAELHPLDRDRLASTHVRSCCGNRDGSRLHCVETRCRGCERRCSGHERYGKRRRDGAK